jgi:hypothetical protein
MTGQPEFQTGFNLIICYFALGDTEKMKRGTTLSPLSLSLSSFPFFSLLSSYLPSFRLPEAPCDPHRRLE